MSGGSYEYAYGVVEQFADALEAGRTVQGRETENPNSLPRLAFARHLRSVAAATKAIEWVDSYDSSPPEDEHAIHAVIGT